MIEERARSHRERVPHPRPEPVHGRNQRTKGRGEGGVASDMTDKHSSSAKAPTPPTNRVGEDGAPAKVGATVGPYLPILLEVRIADLPLKNFIVNGCPILAPSLSMGGINGRKVGARVGLLAIWPTKTGQVRRLPPSPTNRVGEDGAPAKVGATGGCFTSSHLLPLYLFER